MLLIHFSVFFAQNLTRTTQIKFSDNLKYSSWCVKRPKLEKTFGFLVGAFLWDIFFYLFVLVLWVFLVAEGNYIFIDPLCSPPPSMSGTCLLLSTWHLLSLKGCPSHFESPLSMVTFSNQFTWLSLYQVMLYLIPFRLCGVILGGTLVKILEGPVSLKRTWPLNCISMFAGA